jgi:hypothetical protein
MSNRVQKTGVEQQTPGVLEYWSTGKDTTSFAIFFEIQYSNTPSLQYSIVFLLHHSGLRERMCVAFRVGYSTLADYSQKSLLTCAKHCDLLVELVLNYSCVRIYYAFVTAWAFASSWTSRGRSLPAVTDARFGF